MSRLAGMTLLCLFQVGLAAQEIDPSKARTYEQYALTHAGDAAVGKLLFGDKQRTKCADCHRVGSEGGQVGPDLTSIGGKFDRPHLIESLLEPSRQIVEGYRTTTIRKKNGEVMSGIIKARSEEQFTLADATGKLIVISRAEIEELTDSPVSLMPQNLAEALSAEQFTNVVAYLETLQPGGKPKPGAAITGAISLPQGFVVRTLVTGLSGATAMEVARDGRIFLCEQVGAVRVWQDGRLLPEPLVTLSVDSSWERGVIGVTVDPDFPRQPFLYVNWVARDPYPHHRISRFTVDGNVAVRGSEKVLLVGDDQRKLGGKVPSGHQGGGLHFGLDQKLYVGIGEQTAELPAQALDTFQGKLLRINPDGSIPEDNPFLSQTSGKYQAIWALGLRNPFTFAFRPADGMLLINDVGGKFEEINVGKAGANYGWPLVEHGPEPPAPYVGPIHWYPQASISGGAFCPASSSWPTTFQGQYFFADFVHGWIKTLDPKQPQRVETFATGLRRPVDLRFGPDGALYILLRNAWVIDDKFEKGTSSLLEIRHVP